PPAKSLQEARNNSGFSGAIHRRRRLRQAPVPAPAPASPMPRRCKALEATFAVAPRCLQKATRRMPGRISARRRTAHLNITKTEADIRAALKSLSFGE